MYISTSAWVLCISNAGWNLQPYKTGGNTFQVKKVLKFGKRTKFVLFCFLFSFMGVENYQKLYVYYQLYLTFCIWKCVFTCFLECKTRFWEKVQNANFCLFFCRFYIEMLKKHAKNVKKANFDSFWSVQQNKQQQLFWSGLGLFLLGLAEAMLTIDVRSIFFGRVSRVIGSMGRRRQVSVAAT